MKIVKTYFKMVTYILFIIIIINCNESISNRQSKELLNKVKSSHDTMLQKPFVLDSAQLISKLYKDLDIIHGNEFFNFNYAVDYKIKDNTIIIKSSNNIEQHKIDYHIVIENIENKFDKQKFTPYDDNYKYLDSYIKIDGKEVNLKKTKLSNTDGRLVQPALLWYDRDFGASAKYYKLKNKEIFLLRGINLYCNGSQCIDYQLLIIQMQDSKLTANALYFSGKYPYNFENTFLFDKNADDNPEIFVPKSVSSRELQDISDFEMYTINLLDVTRID